MEVFLALDIPPFVMYCVNGKPRSSLFIESTDSMIVIVKLSLSSGINQTYIRRYMQHELIIESQGRIQELRKGGGAHFYLQEIACLAHPLWGLEACPPGKL